jgi:hypothetical protein
LPNSATGNRLANRRLSVLGLSSWQRVVLPCRPRRAPVPRALLRSCEVSARRWVAASAAHRDSRPIRARASTSFTAPSVRPGSLGCVDPVTPYRTGSEAQLSRLRFALPHCMRPPRPLRASWHGGESWGRAVRSARAHSFSWDSGPRSLAKPTDACAAITGMSPNSKGSAGSPLGILAAFLYHLEAHAPQAATDDLKQRATAAHGVQAATRAE